MIRIRDLRKSHGTRVVLDGVTADVDRGEVVVLTGPSGVGKSTLLRCLNYLEPFQSGEIEIAGFRLVPGMDHGHATELRRLREAVGMVFQQFNLFPHMTAIDNITLGPRVLENVPRALAEEKALALLSRVGLADRARSYPHQLSGGQQQRVAIARALAQKPQVLLFDEPTSALDPEMKAEVMDVIRDLARAGMTMMIVTHEAALAKGVATRMWEMRAGRVDYDGPPR